MNGALFVRMENTYSRHTRTETQTLAYSRAFSLLLPKTSERSNEDMVSGTRQFKRAHTLTRAQLPFTLRACRV